MTGAELDRALDAYVRFLESLDESSLPAIERYCAPDVIFRDPFNDVVGVERYRRVLAKMFEDLDTFCFTVITRSRVGEEAFLRWRFEYRIKPGTPWQIIQGMTHLRLDAQGRVAFHEDYWDPASQLYERVPILGWVLRKIRRYLSAG